MDDLVKYINEDSVRGELAREFSEIVSDYHNGKITIEEKKDEAVTEAEGGNKTEGDNTEAPSTTADPAATKTETKTDSKTIDSKSDSKSIADQVRDLRDNLQPGAQLKCNF